MSVALQWHRKSRLRPRPGSGLRAIRHRNFALLKKWMPVNGHRGFNYEALRKKALWSLARWWGDLEALRCLESLYEWFLDRVAHRLEWIVRYSRTLKIEDLKSIGFFGLRKAIMNFDLDQGSRFVSYAYSCIRNEIFSNPEVQKCLYTPQVRAVKKKSGSLMQKLQREPTVDEIAEACDLSPYQVENALEILTYAPIGYDEVTGQGQIVPEELRDAPDQEADLGLQEAGQLLELRKMRLEDAIERLDPVEQILVVEKYFGEKSDEEIQRILIDTLGENLSLEAMRARRSRALDKLEDFLISDFMADVLNCKFSHDWQREEIQRLPSFPREILYQAYVEKRSDRQIHNLLVGCIENDEVSRMIANAEQQLREILNTEQQFTSITFSDERTKVALGRLDPPALAMLLRLAYRYRPPLSARAISAWICDEMTSNPLHGLTENDVSNYRRKAARDLARLLDAREYGLL